MNQEGYKVIVFLSFVVVIIVIHFSRYFLEKKRKKEIEEYCKKNSLEYSNFQKDVLAELSQDESILINDATENNAVALMSGKKNGFNYYLFDYTYTNKSSRGIHSIVHSVCIISKENILFPHFYIRDESILFDHIIDNKAGKDINFTEDSEFSNKFILFGASEEKTRAFFDRNRRDAFVKKHVRGYIYEGLKNYFIVSSDKLFNLKERLVFLDKCMNIFEDIVPDDSL